MNEFLLKQDVAGTYQRVTEDQAQQAITAQNLLVDAETQMVVKDTTLATYTVLPTLKGAKQSEYSEAVLQHTGGSRKAAEELLRTTVSARKSNSVIRADVHQDEDTKDELLKTAKFSSYQNSTQFNDVLVASDVFSGTQKLKNLELGEQFSAARQLEDCCETYLTSHQNPWTEAGTRRKALVQMRKTQAQAAQQKLKQDNPFYPSFLANTVVTGIPAGESGDNIHQTLLTSCQNLIHHYPVPAEPSSQSLLAALQTRLSDESVVTQNIMCHFFPTLAKNDRIIAANQKQVLGQMSKESLEKKMERVFQGINEMIDDILFWGRSLNADNLSDFELTGSDLHERGLGVSIITFSTPTGDQKKVIKPEEKWTEQRLLGCSPDSAASKLNDLVAQGGVTITIRSAGNLRETRVLSPMVRIRTLDMQVQDKHGTMVEYIEPRKVTELTAIELTATETDQKILTQIFADITGMDDLHAENLVYEEDGSGNIRVVMIDADNAMSARMLGHLTEAREKNNGFDKDAQKQLDLINVTGISRDFLKINVKPVFESPQSVCRTVPITTSVLSEIRSTLNEKLQTFERFDKLKDILSDEHILTEIIDILGASGMSKDESQAERARARAAREAKAKVYNHFAIELNISYESARDVMVELASYYYRLITGDIHTKGFSGLISKTQGDSNPEHIKVAVISMLEDMKSGQIPFYEYHPHDGTVTTHGKVVWLGESAETRMSDLALEDIITEMEEDHKVS
jgi:hypothetical protein